jgi:hypothetical protein
MMLVLVYVRFDFVDQRHLQNLIERVSYASFYAHEHASKPRLFGDEEKAQSFHDHQKA